MERSVCVVASSRVVIVDPISMRSAAGWYGSRSIGPILRLFGSLRLIGVLRCIECPTDVIVLVELLDLL
jgi:hypothetical protein